MHLAAICIQANMRTFFFTQDPAFARDCSSRVEIIWWGSECFQRLLTFFTYVVHWFLSRSEYYQFYRRWSGMWYNWYRDACTTMDPIRLHTGLTAITSRIILVREAVERVTLSDSRKV
jgi:hypothetical protein